MKVHAKAYAAILVAFLVIDAVWIGLVARHLYEDDLGDLMRSQPGAVAAGAFYLLYAAGIVFFAVKPALADGSARTALFNGAFLGLLCYGTFTVTNYAILNAWTPMLLVTDILWGMFITGVTAAIGYAVASRRPRA